jgi:hypothetical protein
VCVIVSALVFPGDAHAQDTLGFSADDLKSLIYGDNIPGFRQVSPIRGGDGPQIMLDLPSKKWGPCSWISAAWVSGDELTMIEIQLSVCASRQAAAASAQTFVLASSARPCEDGEERRIGDRSWSLSSAGGAMASAIIGRSLVFLNAVPIRRRAEPGDPWVVTPLDASIGEVVTTLARGIEWNIRQRPELLARSDGTQRRRLIASANAGSGAAAVTCGGTTWARLSDLASAGATVGWDSGANRATVSYRGRTLELRACHRQARSAGRKLDLGARVLLGADGPIVPLRKVAEALGMKVRATKTTIEIG